MSEITEEKPAPETTPVPAPAPSEQKPAPDETQINLLEMKVETESDALNLMAGFLQVAQRRGAYTLSEAAKIMEGINKFGKQ